MCERVGSITRLITQFAHLDAQQRTFAHQQTFALIIQKQRAHKLDSRSTKAKKREGKKLEREFSVDVVVFVVVVNQILNEKEKKGNFAGELKLRASSLLFKFARRMQMEREKKRQTKLIGCRWLFASFAHAKSANFIVSSKWTQAAYLISLACFSIMSPGCTTRSSN